MSSLDLKSGTDRVIVGLILVAAVLAAVVFLVKGGDDGGGATDDTAPGPSGPQVVSALPRCTGGDRLTIPVQKLTAGLLPIQTVQRAGQVQLDPPKDPNKVGWWSLSSKAGHPFSAEYGGQTLVTGHTVHDGAGALNNIGKLKAGEIVEVCHQGGLAQYKVTSVVELSKADVAKRAQELFGQDRKDHRLVLVTCTDWEGPGNYRSNLIVFGEPLQIVGTAA